MMDWKFHRFQRIQKDNIKPCALTKSTEQTKGNCSRQPLPGNCYQATVTRQPLPGNRYQATVTRQPLPGNRYQATVTRQPLPGNRYQATVTRHLSELTAEFHYLLDSSSFLRSFLRILPEGNFGITSINSTCRSIRLF